MKILLNLKKILFVFLLAITSMLLNSCHKEGLGGNASISGLVKHHDALIPNATVYIKYGVTEFPGTDVSVYDASVVADTKANYEFVSLYKGDYFIYGVGIDVNGGVSNSFPVTGGISIKIKHNKAYSIDVPVTE
ncbi:MAG: hypothetical protein ABI315_00525 [Bacteroidia bacterium]